MNWINGKPVASLGYYKHRGRVGCKVLWNTEDPTIQQGSDNIGFTALHETLHQFGLRDRYKDSYSTGKRRSIPESGWEGDIMSGGVKIFQQHYNDWGKKILELAHVKSSSNFILDVKVDY